MGRPRLDEKTKLSRALSELHAVLGADRGVVRGPQLNNATRRLLLEKGFLREILKGWYFVSDPTAATGETTPFYANFWEYLSSYLTERFGEGYCLNAEHSLLRHVQHNVVPKQVNVLLATNTSQVLDIAFGHSLMLYPAGANFPAADRIAVVGGLRCMSLPYCLVMLPPRVFAQAAKDVQIALSALDDPAAVAALVDDNLSGVARVVAGLRRIGRNAFAEDVLRQLEGLNLKLPAETDAFAGQPAYILGDGPRSPLYTRLKLLWARHRETVLQVRPTPIASGASVDAYLRHIEGVRLDDTYHSLSIERYRVTPALIAKVASGEWNPDLSSRDQQQVEAMAARGYLDAFALVQADAGQAFAAGPTPAVAARLFRERHQAWYQGLFGPSVTAGILTRSDLVGYRRHMVFLRGSLHSPPHYDYVRDGMSALQECFAEELDAFVRAVLGHWLFGFVHPYMDGNGRMARFAMNLMLASGGYPWTIIRVEDREAYMAALERASVDDNLAPFARFIADSVVADAGRFANPTV